MALLVAALAGCARSPASEGVRDTEASIGGFREILICPAEAPKQFERITMTREQLSFYLSYLGTTVGEEWKPSKELLDRAAHVFRAPARLDRGPEALMLTTAGHLGVYVRLIPIAGTPREIRIDAQSYAHDKAFLELRGFVRDIEETAYRLWQEKRRN